MHPDAISYHTWPYPKGRNDALIGAYGRRPRLAQCTNRLCTARCKRPLQPVQEVDRPIAREDATGKQSVVRAGAVRRPRYWARSAARTALNAWLRRLRCGQPGLVQFAAVSAPPLVYLRRRGQARVRAVRSLCGACVPRSNDRRHMRARTSNIAGTDQHQWANPMVRRARFALKGNLYHLQFVPFFPTIHVASMLGRSPAKNCKNDLDDQT